MIKGSTQLVAILGSPITQVKSPANFNQWFAAQGLDLAMIPIDMGQAQLGEFVQSLRGWHNLRGCVVTVPYKQVIADQLDHLSERARALGSVNVIRRDEQGQLSGDNVDGEGFLNAARAHGFDPYGKSALVIGAGGVGSAIAWSLCQAGLKRLCLQDVSALRLDRLTRLLAGNFAQLDITQHCSDLAGFDLVANATPVGMGDSGELPMAAALLEQLEAATLVADVVTSPVMTPLLAMAQARGCRIQTGEQMALAQMGNLGHFMTVTPLHVQPVEATG